MGPVLDQQALLAVECHGFTTGCVFAMLRLFPCDVCSLPHWSGVERSEVLGKAVTNIFEGAGGATVPNPELEKAAARCYDFQVHSFLIVHQAAQSGTYPGAAALLMNECSFMSGLLLHLLQ